MKNELNPEEKKILIAWGIVGIIIFLAVVGLKFLYIDPKKKAEYTDDEYKIVTNYDRYYTVIGVINKYYAFYNAKNYDSLLHTLSNKYIEEQKITIDNIKEFLPENDKSLSFSGNIMCSKNIDQGITSYIIEGDEKDMNTGEVLEKKYYNVILDGNEFVFSIEPIDNEFYGGNCNE